MKIINTSSRLFIITLMICAFFTTAHARTDDSEKPIHISADSAELNDKTGVSIYHGNVKMMQGTTILQGQEITVHAKNNVVGKMIAIGDLATYQETTDEGDIIYAQSEKMIHHINEKKIELFRQAKITQLDNVITSEYIKYLTEEGLIDTGTKLDRVNITITPQSELSNDNAE